MPRRKNGGGVSCGNAGAVESVESQKQAFPSFHEPLGNLAQRRRDPHISTTPAAIAGGAATAPIPQAKFSTFKAAARRPGFNSATSRFKDGMISPSPSPQVATPQRPLM